MKLSDVPLPQHDPERKAVQRIIAWVAENTWADAIEPKRLASEAREVSLADLLRAFIFLQSQGVFEVRYRPISPATHQIVHQDFESPIEIRKAIQIRDASENVFDGWDVDFVQVFIPTEHWR